MCNAGPPHCIPSFMILGMRNKVSMKKRKKKRKEKKDEREGRRDYIAEDGLCVVGGEFVK